MLLCYFKSNIPLISAVFQFDFVSRGTFCIISAVFLFAFGVFLSILNDEHKFSTLLNKFSIFQHNILTFYYKNGIIIVLKCLKSTIFQHFLVLKF